MSVIMRRVRQTALCAAMLAGASIAWQQSGAQAPATPAAAPTGAEAEGIIFERQQIMLQLGKDAEHLGNVVAGLAPASELKDATRAVANGARDSYKAFQQKVPGGRAKPEVWSNYDDYMAHMKKFVDASENMAKMAEAGQNAAAITSVMGDALPCKQCHDVYREPKKPGA